MCFVFKLQNGLSLLGCTGETRTGIRGIINMPHWGIFLSFDLELSSAQTRLVLVSQKPVSELAQH